MTAVAPLRESNIVVTEETFLPQSLKYWLSGFLKEKKMLTSDLNDTCAIIWDSCLKLHPWFLVDHYVNHHKSKLRITGLQLLGVHTMQFEGFNKLVLESIDWKVK